MWNNSVSSLSKISKKSSKNRQAATFVQRVLGSLKTGDSIFFFLGRSYKYEVEFTLLWATEREHSDHILNICTYYLQYGFSVWALFNST